MNLLNSQCRWCHQLHGPLCPWIKAIELYEDGITIKRVEFKAVEVQTTIKATPLSHPSPYILPENTCSEMANACEQDEGA